MIKEVDRVGFESVRYISIASILDRNDLSQLRSWVQIPPGPLFTVLEIRY
jgi:hypothetical protein